VRRVAATIHRAYLLKDLQRIRVGAIAGNVGLHPELRQQFSDLASVDQ
jgi:hypothetical protein